MKGDHDGVVISGCWPVVTWCASHVSVWQKQAVIPLTVQLGSNRMGKISQVAAVPSLLETWAKGPPPL